MSESDSQYGDEEELPQPQQPAWRRAGQLSFKFMLILGGVFLLFVLGLSLFFSFSLEGLQSAQDRLAQADGVLMWFRLLLIAVLIGFWQPINVWLAQRNAWSPERLQRVLHGRWLTLAVLLFVELVLVQRLHEPFIDGMVR